MKFLSDPSCSAVTYRKHYDAHYRAKYPQRIKESNRAWYGRNRAQILDRKKWQRRNKICQAGFQTFWGKTCYCGQSLRFIATGSCIDCARNRARIRRREIRDRENRGNDRARICVICDAVCFGNITKRFCEDCFKQRRLEAMKLWRRQHPRPKKELTPLRRVQMAKDNMKLAVARRIIRLLGLKPNKDRTVDRRIVRELGLQL